METIFFINKDSPYVTIPLEFLIHDGSLHFSFMDGKGVLVEGSVIIKANDLTGCFSFSYLSSTVCSEFIDILGIRVERVILDVDLSVDSTPDVFHTDQLTLIFRYVLPDGPIERFLTFIPLYKHTGVNLAHILLDYMDHNGINVQDSRASTQLLMAVFKPLHLPAVKVLSGTQWSECHDATHVLKVGYTAIVEVLRNMASDEDEKLNTKEKSLGLIKTMAKLETGIMVEIWSCILERFHKTRKVLQDSKLDINALLICWIR
ncbi:hypothetical protein GQR58_012949 [Nymphon striatum]|nr:hypothetical protein GQR58_012949 [Nymphon striatum]